MSVEQGELNLIRPISIKIAVNREIKTSISQKRQKVHKKENNYERYKHQ
jgi:hypothetical protein